MQYDAIMVRLGELFLKGKNRHRFIDRLFQTVRTKLEMFPDLVIETKYDHFLIYLNGTDDQLVRKQLDLVFGIHSYAFGKLCESTIESICETALPVAVEACSDGKSIKFETRRGWKNFPFGSIQISQQVAEYVGGHAPEGSIRFNVAEPDLAVRIFVKKDHTLVVAKIELASGGLPIGLNGRTLLMLSGGLDSPVAAYLMMKRGLEVQGIHFESPPYTTARARQKVYDLAEKLAHYLPRNQFRIIIVPFTKLQKEIFAHTPESYGMTIMRRMMYRVTAGVAERHKIRLLSNGESLGQVASQTPDSMWAINAVTEMPIIRPVACMDKTEIMELSRRIDTYDISIRPFEDCCTVFVPKSPSTAPNRKKCEEHERKFDWEPLVQECIENTEIIDIRAGHPITLDSDTTDEICDLL
ncbi:tRNA 4-thiouridine(8) synthase ThiI [Pontiellaceae bacterium B12219]|nr:tRNA 4-thiouridine(8) synthase ThiI [Pontiellaceae bacterium B12219]